MLIKRVELENIKSHASAEFDFERGSTAITGENGAGKTTIIEAIAWTLFDTLDYKKDDFVRRGTKKGTVRVTFESSLDQRDYTVHRDTGTGYYVRDPRLDSRIAEKKEEVTRFLWQHLGVEPGTDLEALFKQAIGVPQGTFTAVFLGTPAERKSTFDALLKVEEYRRGADELLKTSRFDDGRIAAVNVNIARAEGEIARITTVEIEHSTVKALVNELRSALDQIQRETNAKLAEVRELDEQEAKLGSLLAELEKTRNERARADMFHAQRKAELDLAREAAAQIEAVKSDHAKHIDALARLKELERERDAREKLRIACTKIESAIAAIHADQKHLNRDLESIQKSHAAIESLKTLVLDQERLERDVERLRADVNRLDAALAKMKGLDEQLHRLRESYRMNTAQLNEAREKGAGAERLNELESRDSELVRELASLQAALERDERFQTEIQNGLCPILSEKCLNLKQGQTLEMFVTSQFGELKTKITMLENEKVSITTALTTSREAAKYLAQISVLESRAKEIEADGNRLKHERAALEKETSGIANAKAVLERIENELKALENPRAKIELLENEARRETEIREKLSEIEKNLERLESDRRINAEELESYKDLDKHLAETNEIRDRTADAYKTFLSNEGLAKTVSEREAAFANSQSSLEAVVSQLAETETIYAEAGKGYDREKHRSERAALVELQKQQAETNARYEAAAKRESELASELKRLSDIRDSMENEFRERDRLKKVAEVTDFIRSTLKEAAPLVARNYVYHVSVEANHMFREITGAAECTLKWTEDYGIVMEQDGYERPFQSLSGGEQMAAALSVRLALLKQLSDIRIAFFDEPTTNMDSERRENLARQIGQIRHFDQLFVISHDDTFEGYMDHELKIGV
jgi:exonuclease SbcC